MGVVSIKLCRSRSYHEIKMSNASDTYPLQASAIKKGAHAVMKGHPCKVIEMSTSKTGKHGHAKVHMVGLDIFTNRKLEDICPSTHNMDVPNVSRKDFQLMAIDDGYVDMMDDEGNQRSDLQLPEDDMGKEIKQAAENGETFYVTVLKACGEEKIIGKKVMT